MSRPKNPENNYELKDAVTGEPLHTNPKQFRELQTRYNVTAEELKASYVGQGGRNKLVFDKETVASAMEKYNLHPNIANALRALRSKPIKAVSKPVETDMSINVAENAIAPVETNSNEETEQVQTGSVMEDEEELVIVA